MLPEALFPVAMKKTAEGRTEWGARGPAHSGILRSHEEESGSDRRQGGWMLSQEAQGERQTQEHSV